MIFKLKFDDRTEFAKAKDRTDLESSYNEDFGGFEEVTDVTEISEEEAKTIMLKNIDYDETDPDDSPEFSLFDTVSGDDFCIVGSTDWD